MKYTHFTKDQRNEISVLLNKGYSIRDIAYAIKKNPSSVSREISKNSVNGQYDPDKAHHKARTRRRYSKHQGMKIVQDKGLRDYIEEKMAFGHWSPEQIAGRLKLKNNNQAVITFKSIYKYLYTVYGQHLCKYLRYKQNRPSKRQQSIAAKQAIQNRVFIGQRPVIINNRRRYGDFEGDTLGIPRGTKQTIAALIERKSRYLLAKKIKEIKYTIEAFNELLAPIPALSLTLDNGPENAGHRELDITTYFCNAYCSWEKGSIENAFSLIRRYIPKKKDIAQYSDKYINTIVNRINNTPRKCLGFRTAKEVFEQNYLAKHSLKAMPKATNLLTLKCCTSG